MSTSLDAMPYEILSTIVSYSAEDPYSLLSLIKTSHFLRHHAERHFYRVMDLSDTSIDLTLRFLKSIELHPRTGSLVASFRPHTIKYHGPSKQPKEYVDLFLSATRFMPNLKCLGLVQDHHAVPKALQWGHGTQPPFRLDRLAVQLEWNSLAARDIWDPQRFKKELLQLLQHQKTLRHLSLVLEMDRDIGGQVVPGLSPEESVEKWREACSSIEILEGTNSTIRLVLPNTQRIKALFWHCDRSDVITEEPEPFRSLSDLDTDPILKKDFFTPGHCEAYGRLENLAISHQISLLPILSTYLTSLKTLVLIIPASALERGESTTGKEDLFLQAIGELVHLMTLAVMYQGDLDLDYERIFAACANLQRLALWEVEDGEPCPESVSMERDADGMISLIEWASGEEMPLIPYVWAGWFTFGSEDLT